MITITEVQAQSVETVCPVIVAEDAFIHAVNTPQYHWSERALIKRNIEDARQALTGAVLHASGACLEVVKPEEAYRLKAQKINCPVLRKRLGLNEE